MSGRKNNSSSIPPSVFIIGIPLFLLIEHPVAFWLAFVPLLLIFIVGTVKWFKGGSMNCIIAAFVAFLLMIPLALVLGNSDKCEHEEVGKQFFFQFENDAGTSHTKLFCKTCHQTLKTTTFRGTPSDISYLGIVNDHIDGSEIVPGEYYTMTAIVSATDCGINESRIRCKVEGKDVTVGFSVEFRDEFEEQVSSIQEGDEITFRGRLYDDGFGWTDCELLDI